MIQTDCFSSISTVTDCALGFAEGFNVLTAALAVIGLAFIWRLLLSHYRRRQLAWVELMEFETSSDKAKQETKGLTALTRALLSESGLLPPPAVPSGSVDQNIVSMVESSTLPQAKVFAGLITAVLRLVRPSMSYRAKGTLLTREATPPCGLTIELSGVSGRTVAIRTFWCKTFALAAQEAASFMYSMLLSQRPSSKRPIWTQWTLPGSGLTQYRLARDYERQGSIEKAMECYRAALEIDPRNALARLQLGSLFLLQKRFLDALETYSRIVVMWPHLIEARYRLAAALGFSEKLAVEFEALNIKEQEAKREMLDDLRKRILDMSHMVSDGDWPQTLTRRCTQSDALSRFFSQDAKAHWSDLKRRLEWRNAFLAWYWTPALSRYLRPYAWPWPLGKKRRQLRGGVEAAYLVAAIHAEPACSSSCLEAAQHRLNELMSARDASWLTFYNGACFYARAIERCPEEEEQLLSGALQAIKRVVATRESHVDSWLCRDDPDLEAIRRGHPSAFAAVTGCSKGTRPKEGPGGLHDVG